VKESVNRRLLGVAALCAIAAAIIGTTRLGGRPDELLERQDFEELFLGAGTTMPALEEDDDKR
jgi:hypothetical protein